MKNEDWKKNLQPGDEITWHDPDNGLCTRTGKIHSIVYNGNVALVQWQGGGLTEMFLDEIR